MVLLAKQGNRSIWHWGLVPPVNHSLATVSQVCIFFLSFMKWKRYNQGQGRCKDKRLKHIMMEKIFGKLTPKTIHHRLWHVAIDPKFTSAHNSYSATICCVCCWLLTSQLLNAMNSLQSSSISTSLAFVCLLLVLLCKTSLCSTCTLLVPFHSNLKCGCKQCLGGL